MQFDRAEPVKPSAPPVCMRCNGILSGVYYSAKGTTLCSACGQALKGMAGPFDGMQFAIAAAAGVAAVLAGAVVNGYVASRTENKYVFLLLIFAGYLVGTAVRWGSGGRGGRPYQFLAVSLTYLALSAFFYPLIPGAEGGWSYQRIVTSLVVIPVGPFLAGLKGLFLWVLLGVSVVQAWRINRTALLDVTGPHPLGQTMPPDGRGGV